MTSLLLNICLNCLQLSFGMKEKSSGKTFPEFCQLTLASATMPTSIPTILGDIIAVRYDLVDYLYIRKLNEKLESC